MLRQSIKKEERNKKQWQIIMMYEQNYDAKIYLHNYAQPNILKYIGANNKFYQLRDLVLDNNKMTSIEFIDRVFMPKIQKISFSYNFLINLQSLRKCNFINLNSLIVYGYQEKFNENSQIYKYFSEINAANLSDIACGKDCLGQKQMQLPQFKTKQRIQTQMVPQQRQQLPRRQRLQREEQRRRPFIIRRQQQRRIQYQKCQQRPQKLQNFIKLQSNKLKSLNSFSTMSCYRNRVAAFRQKFFINN